METSMVECVYKKQANDNLYFQRVFLSRFKEFYRFDRIIPLQHLWHLGRKEGMGQ